MDKEQIIKNIVRRITDCNNTSYPMIVGKWDWIPGVGMYGVTRAWQYTNDPDTFRFITNWIETHLQEAYKIKTVNSTTPLLTVLEIYKKTKKAEYLKVCIDIAEWILNEAPKTRDGGLEHTVTEHASFSEQMWADTLFMACIFLAKLGRVTSDNKYVKEAVKQLAVHHNYLKDTSTGVFYHAWNCVTRDWMSAALWARANAWMILSTVEMLDELPDSFEGRSMIHASLCEQVKALQGFQRKNGAFGTLLDHADCYDEISATAGIAYGIKRGIKKGYLSSEYEQVWKKADKAVLEQVNEKGEVMGVSGGTAVKSTQEDYKAVPIKVTLYGQALALLLLCEE